MTDTHVCCELHRQTIRSTRGGLGETAKEAPEGPVQFKTGQRHCWAPCCLAALRTSYRTLSLCLAGIWLLIGRNDSLDEAQPAPQSKQGVHAVASVP